jgi:hypothetical protein
VVLIFRYTVGERFGKGKQNYLDKKKHYVDIGVNKYSYGQNKLFNSIPILFFPQSKANITPTLSLSLIVTK